MEDSTFTKIIKGDIPSHKVYEDDRTMVIVDIYPEVPGMCVVFPKTQVAHFEDLSDDDYQALWATVKKLAKRMREVFPEVLKIGARVEGFDVAHAHVVVRPLHSAGDLERKADLNADPDHETLAGVAEKLKF